ncbi:hypothetical protein Rhow_004566 [Rhodococcus wratislaviensis]|uniref:Uncharacterized protein n=1 Tax=Rhodococcus wratislaviensis TaxID=44752 RepID=A0A402CBI4_RHOWR|nr:hypothetical protein Rhow_004566 [Rhodococcus wratislaviensis]
MTSPGWTASHVDATGARSSTRRLSSTRRRFVTAVYVGLPHGVGSVTTFVIFPEEFGRVDEVGPLLRCD